MIFGFIFGGLLIAVLVDIALCVAVVLWVKVVCWVAVGALVLFGLFCLLMEAAFGGVGRQGG